MIVSVVCKNDPRPKLPRSYRNTVIYKIFCKDSTISEVYIGHSSNFYIRKRFHFKNIWFKRTKLYTFIRSNGGWKNWDFVILGTYNCSCFEDACRIEWYWWMKHTNTLNTVVPGINYITQDMETHDNIDEYISNLELKSRKTIVVKDL